MAERFTTMPLSFLPQIGFKPHYQGSKIKSVRELTKQMKAALEEAKLAI